MSAKKLDRKSTYLAITLPFIFQMLGCARDVEHPATPTPDLETLPVTTPDLHPPPTPEPVSTERPEEVLDNGGPDVTEPTAPPLELPPSIEATPTPSPVAMDNDGDGYSLDDCDDWDPETYPGAIDYCDNRDNDCDLRVDEDPGWRFYPDTDGDGFGVLEGEILACQAPEDYSSARGDCDDQDPTVYPGAEDPETDGIDQDCGGHEGPQAAVGLGAGSYQTLAEALAASNDGDTVWVGPATYLEHDILFPNKSIRLISTEGPLTTFVDAQGLGRGMSFQSGVGPGASVEGFTFENGYAANGGALFGSGVSPRLEDLVLRRNVADTQGGGLAFNGGAVIIRRCVLEENESLTNIGGGAFLSGWGSPSLEDVTFRNNTSKYDGGGMYMSISSGVVMKRVTFEGNSTLGQGGGAYFKKVTATVTDTQFLENQSEEGAGLYVYLSTLSAQGLVLEGNRATTRGGGAFLYQSNGDFRLGRLEGNVSGDAGGALFLHLSSPQLTDLDIRSNIASYRGAGFYLNDSSPTLIRASVLDNEAQHGDGGGGVLEGSSATLSGCLFAGNRSARNGGGLFLSSSSPSLLNLTVADNLANEGGGGVYLATGIAGTDIRNTIMAFNTGLDLVDASGEADAWTIEYSNLFSPFMVSELPAEKTSANLSVDPRFVTFDPDQRGAQDLYLLRPDSSLIDAGDPSFSDRDLSRADIGAFGGPDGSLEGYLDAEGDGLYDEFESDHGLDPTVDDAASDLDGDGIDNLDEFLFGCDPRLPDSDADGATDGEEQLAGSDPTDWYSQPGMSGPATARVPGDFDSIQEAIDHIRWEGKLLLSAEEYLESVLMLGKKVAIQGEAGAAATRVSGQSGSVISSSWTSLDLRGVTLSGGQSTLGGGLFMRHSTGRLSHLVIERNSAVVGGGGLYLSDSSPEISNSVLRNNQSYEGGGVYLLSSSASFSHVRVIDNVATQSGGGIYAFYSEPVLAHLLLSGNRASRGGGLCSDYSSPVVTHSVLITNEASEEGGGMYMAGGASSPSLLSSILAYNGSEEIANDLEDPVKLSMMFCDVYGQSGTEGANFVLPSLVLSVEPLFNAYDAAGIPLTGRLAAMSPLVDAGDPDAKDADGSEDSLGLYGGEGGDAWDLDDDRVPDWFWPGDRLEAPKGFSPDDFDVDDFDAGIH